LNKLTLPPKKKQIDMLGLKTNWILILIVAVAASCTTGSKVASLREDADEAMENEAYAAALAGYEQIIASYRQEGNTDQCPVYGKAGIAALETGNLTKAVDYFQMDTYTPFATADTYYGLAKSYRSIDNLSKEILALKDYIELFPNGEHIDEVRARLFETYVESENWEFALELWPELPAQLRDKPEYLEQWFTVNLALGNNEVVDELAERLLKNDPDHIKALEWKAEKAYKLAEDHYQREMKAYEKNRTNKQYKILLAELDKVTAEFQVALEYYEKLYSLTAKPAYAQYISNIYVRFNDKEKADYYRKKAGN
jgi:tetratricopeptide (TPR) repeat protein